jgi:hypothetical protein
MEHLGVNKVLSHLLEVDIQMLPARVSQYPYLPMEIHWRLEGMWMMAQLVPLGFSLEVEQLGPNKVANWSELIHLLLLDGVFQWP